MNIHETLHDFLTSKSLKSPNTVVWYESQLSRWIHWLDTNGADWMSPDDLETYFAYERGRGLGDRSLEAHYVATKAFFAWLQKRRPAMLNGHPPPTDIVERPKAGVRRPRVASYESVCKLIRSIAGETWLDYRDRAVVQLMLSTGLRVEEVVNLRTNHIEVSDKFVFVQGGKGDKDRVVPYDTDFANAFAGWVYNRPMEVDDWLFVGADIDRQPTGQVTTNAVRKMLQRRCDDCGLAYVNPHSLRHLFATKALNEGVALSAVSAMLGHASVSFTAKVYAKWLKDGLRREYDQHWREMAPA